MLAIAKSTQHVSPKGYYMCILHCAKPTRIKKQKPTGYILYETKDIVCIATLDSANRKTGKMIQVWFLAKAEKPTAAAASGLNKLVCFDCKHRPGVLGSCYVNLGQAPNQIWRTWQAGRYPKITKKIAEKLFATREIRFGAYGEPVLLPFSLLASIARAIDCPNAIACGQVCLPVFMPCGRLEPD